MVQTLTFQTLYVLFLISHDRRRLLHFNVTVHPNRGLGLAPVDRGHALGSASQLPDPRPRSRLRRRLRDPAGRSRRREHPHTDPGAPGECHRGASCGDPTPRMSRSHPAAERAASPIGVGRVRNLLQPGSTSSIPRAGDSCAEPSLNRRGGGLPAGPRRSSSRLRASRPTGTRLLPPYSRKALVGRGFANKQIARGLGISEKNRKDALGEYLPAHRCERSHSGCSLGREEWPAGWVLRPRSD